MGIVFREGNLKNMSFKRMTALTLLMCLVLTLGACGGGENSQSTEGAAAGDTYKVTVVDGMGNPYTSGVIVRFMQGGSQVTMQVVDENGVAEKELEDGDYTVELQFTGGEEYYYDQNDLTLSADKKELTITLMGTVSGEAKQLAAPEGTRDAWDLQAGTTYVELTPGQRNYFLFTPTWILPRRSAITARPISFRARALRKWRRASSPCPLRAA